MSVDSTWIQKRSKEAVEWKSALARYSATHLVDHGDIVYIASGTQMSALMWEIVSRQASKELLDLLVVTSNLQIVGMGRQPFVNDQSSDPEEAARFLNAFQATQILVIGGVHHPSLDSLIGDQAVRGIDDPEISPTTVFMGARGLSFADGLTMTYQFRDEISTQMAYQLRPTRRRVILCDHSKLGVAVGIRATAGVEKMLENAEECIFLTSDPEDPVHKRRVDGEILEFEKLCGGLAKRGKCEGKELALWLIDRQAERKKVISLSVIRGDRVSRRVEQSGEMPPNKGKTRLDVHRKAS
jgi:DeoR/GlpR family transcriptional regulator of sugar metabolism